jgi:hypothetical protein
MARASDSLRANASRIAWMMAVADVRPSGGGGGTCCGSSSRVTHLGEISLRGEPSPEGATGVGWAAVSGDQAELPGPRGGLGAVGGPELAQDVGHVLFHGVEGDHQLLGDARVRGASGQ